MQKYRNSIKSLVTPVGFDKLPAEVAKDILKYVYELYNAGYWVCSMCNLGACVNVDIVNNHVCTCTCMYYFCPGQVVDIQTLIIKRTILMASSKYMQSIVINGW